MDLIQIGVQLLQSQLGNNLKTNDIASALSGLLGGKDFDLASLVAKMQGNAGLASMVTSWLGDGANAAITGNQVMDIFGKDKVSEFASKLNIDTGTASKGLADMLPKLIDKASSGGSLLDSAMSSIGGAGGLMGMAGKLFGK
ncbi:MAG: DUF937 domain-containing protein [Gammaproteobacteria bacterium]|nr:DUF937 domain-containing protein [Gammaproteobacteria bacterium]